MPGPIPRPFHGRSPGGPALLGLPGGGAAAGGRRSCSSAWPGTRRTGSPSTPPSSASALARPNWCCWRYGVEPGRSIRSLASERHAGLLAAGGPRLLRRQLLPGHVRGRAATPGRRSSPWSGPSCRYQAAVHRSCCSPRRRSSSLAMETELVALIVALFAFPLAAMYVSAAMSVQREHQANHDELTGLLNRKLLAKRGDEALASAGVGGHQGRVPADRPGPVDRPQAGQRHARARGRRPAAADRGAPARAQRPARRRGGPARRRRVRRAAAVGQGSRARPGRSHRRLRAALAEPVRLEAMTFQVEASVGIAIYPDDASGFEQLMQRADVAMYVAKERGSGIERYTAEPTATPPTGWRCSATCGRPSSAARSSCTTSPRSGCPTGQVIGMEALARWPHPRRGVLAAADFVGLAEQSAPDAASSPSRSSTRRCAQAARWWKDGHAGPGRASTCRPGTCTAAALVETDQPGAAAGTACRPRRCGSTSTSRCWPARPAQAAATVAGAGRARRRREPR